MSITIDLPALALIFLAGVIFGWFILWVMAHNSNPPKQATAENYVERKRRQAYHPLDWLPGNKKELVLLRLRNLKTFKMLEYVRPHLLTDPEWRRARRELIDCNILHVPKGTTALLTESGAAWVENELGTNEHGIQTVKAGEGGRAPLPETEKWVRIQE